VAIRNPADTQFELIFGRMRSLRKTFLKDGRVDKGPQRRWSNGTIMDGCAIDVQLEERAI
jgi:hypothetical protein